MPNKTPTPRADTFVADYIIANYQMGTCEATDVIINQMAAMEREIAAKQCVVSVEEIGNVFASTWYDQGGNVQVLQCAELQKDKDQVSVFKKIDEYHLSCSHTYGPYPNDYQSGVLQGLSCARALAVDGEKS